MMRAERRFKSGRQGASREEWKLAQSDYRGTVDRKRSDSWRGKIESDKNPRRLWQSIQKVCGNNGQKLDTDLTPNDFSAYFEKKVEDIRASTSNAPLPRIQSTASSLMTTFGATTNEQVARLISAAPTKHYTLDPIPTWLLKDCVAELSPFLTDLFNASILVTAEVLPALKSACRHQID